MKDAVFRPREKDPNKQVFLRIITFRSILKLLSEKIWYHLKADAVTIVVGSLAILFNCNNIAD